LHLHYDSSAHKTILAYLVEKQAEEKKRAGEIALSRANKNSTQPASAGLDASAYASARGKGARDYVPDTLMNQLKGTKKNFQIREEDESKPGVASEYIEADKTSNCYDHEVMKCRSTKPKSAFPKLQNNEISKYTYYYQAVSYLDKTYGHHKFLTVVNKSGADQWVPT
jgi:hypothetical protein